MASGRPLVMTEGRCEQPASEARSFQARAIVATAITCLQAANEEWLRRQGSTPLFDLYDTAMEAIRNPN